MRQSELRLNTSDVHCDLSWHQAFERNSIQPEPPFYRPNYCTGGDTGVLVPLPCVCSNPLWLAISVEIAVLTPLPFTLRGEAPATPAHADASRPACAVLSAWTDVPVAALYCMHAASRCMCRAAPCMRILSSPECPRRPKRTKSQASTSHKPRGVIVVAAIRMVHVAAPSIRGDHRSRLLWVVPHHTCRACMNTIRMMPAFPAPS